MLTYRTGAAGSPEAAQSMASYLTEATVPTAEAQLAAYYAQDRGTEEGMMMGMGTVPMPRRDMHADIASALGLAPDKPLSVMEFAYILQGRRADGGDVPTARRPQFYKAKTNGDGIAVGEGRVSISYIDLTLSAGKSVSVAWAFAPETERQAIAQAHRTARDQTLAYVESEIAKRGFGDGHARGMERGSFTWISCDHYTARPTLALPLTDSQTGVTSTTHHTVGQGHIAGDPQLHSHCIVPNLMVMESGRLISIDRDLLQNRVHEFGAVYQAILARELRAIGMDAVLDTKTLMATMPAVPDLVSESFSKRGRDAEGAARDQATKEGEDWDAMTSDQKIRFLKLGSLRTRQNKAELSDAFAWRQQARALGYDPKTFITSGPKQPPLERSARLDAALATTLPLFSDELVKRAVVTGGDARLAAARGLIEWGIESTADIDAITREMVKNGVMQDGQKTDLLWRVDERGRVRITTELHKGQEEELIALARKAAADMSLALPKNAITAAVKNSGLDFAGEHGASQLAAIHSMGSQGGLAVMIGSAGAGKTASATPLVSAWKKAGNEVYGTALSWRQAGELKHAGIEWKDCRAMQPFLDAVHDGRIKLNDKSVVVVDELGQIGTRQLLDLLRLRDASGAKIVAMGDDRQCASIEAGPVIELLRKALGEERIPEIFTTIRQRTEAEIAIVNQFRAGKVAEAVAAKRGNGTATLVEGGYRHAVDRVATLYMERRREHPEFIVTISAPTNEDARQISRAIREKRREIGDLGRDVATKTASDGRSEPFNIRLAQGDNIRLFKRTRGVFTDSTGRRHSSAVGDNGTVLRVLDVDAAKGLTVRTASGKSAFVAWSEMQHRGSDALAITYGDCLTIDSSQGITSDEHIHAFPSGSQAVSGFKNYVAQTRHRVQSFMVGSMGAEMRGAMASRPMGLPEPKGTAAQDDAWANVVRNFERTPLKESALAMLGALTEGRRNAAKALQAGLRNIEAHKRLGQKPTLGQRFRRTRAVKALTEVVGSLGTVVQQQETAMRTIRTSVAPVQLRMKISESDAQMQFARFMELHGLRPQGVPKLDGQIHYVPVQGNKGADKSGAYRAWYDGVVPAGFVLNYKTGGAKVTWKADGEYVPMDTAEVRAMRERAEADRIAKAAAQQQREADGARRAQAVLDASKPADASHPYLIAKGIQAHGARQNGAGGLVIPLRTADGVLRNIQTITVAGEKRPVTGAKKQETLYLMGTPEPGKPLFIAEGFATAATVREATGAAVAMAIDTSNLGPATRALKAAYPDALLVMAADNDAHLPLRPAPDTRLNVGVEKAREVAADVGARVVVAPEVPMRTASGKGSDWNDFGVAYGLDSTRAVLRQALKESALMTEKGAEKPAARLKM